MKRKRGRKPVIPGLILDLVNQRGGQITEDYKMISGEIPWPERSIRAAVRRLLQESKLVRKAEKLCLPTTIPQVPEGAGLAEQLIASLQENVRLVEIVCRQEVELRRLEERLTEAVAIAKEEDEKHRKSLEVIRLLQVKKNQHAASLEAAVERFTGGR